MEKIKKVCYNTCNCTERVILMPYIKTKTSTPISAAQEASLKAKLGKAITALGKGEAWLMLEFEDNCRLWFRGDNSEPLAMVEVSLFGKASADQYDDMTKAVCGILQEELGIDPVTAEEEACMMEHAISDDSFEKWAVFIGDMTTAIIIKRNMQPMIDNIWNTRTPEDYSEYYSRIKANFESQWFHERTTVGKGMRSLEEMMEASDENEIRFDVPDKKDYTEEVINRMAWERFTSTLSKRDREILDLKAKGFTDKEIAEKVGYKTHSAVVKRIQKIASLLEDFSREDYREYQKTFKE